MSLTVAGVDAKFLARWRRTGVALPERSSHIARTLQMSKQSHINLSRRERQIMDIIYQRGQATAAEVTENLPDPPSYSAVRAMLRLLEEKGHLRHEQDGPRYLFKPTLARDRAKKSALKQMLQTFFDGSIEQAVATLLDVSRSKISQEELDRLSKMIEEARKEGL
jgi:BlaI family transcriptional regulator, penicillinase repressor